MERRRDSTRVGRHRKPGDHGARGGAGGAGAAKARPPLPPEARAELVEPRETTFMRFAGWGGEHNSNRLSGLGARAVLLDLSEFLLLLRNLSLLPGHVSVTDASGAFRDTCPDNKEKELRFTDYCECMQLLRERLGLDEEGNPVVQVREEEEIEVLPPMICTAVPMGVVDPSPPRVCWRDGCKATVQNGAVLSSPRRHPLFLCSHCRKAVYCSISCQRESWRSGHKEECLQHSVLKRGADDEASAVARRPPPAGTAPTHTPQQRRTVIHLQERRQAGDWRGGERMHREALETAARTKDSWPDGAMSIYNNLGICYQLAGQYERARLLHKQHLELAQSSGDRRGEGAANGNIGLCLDSLGHHEQALSFLEMSLAIAQEVGDKDAEGGCFGNLANVRESLAQNGKEMKEKLLAIAREAGENSMLGDLSKCSFSLGQFAQSIVLPRAEPFGSQASAPWEQDQLIQLVLLPEARAAAQGQASWEHNDMNIPQHGDGGASQLLPRRRPRAILAEAVEDGVRATQPRDVSLILAGAFRTGNRANAMPAADIRVRTGHKVAQRARKLRALALETPAAIRAAAAENSFRLGQLVVRVIGAEQLLAADSDGKSDPFVDIFVSNKQKGKQVRKTAVKPCTRWVPAARFDFARRLLYISLCVIVPGACCLHHPVKQACFL